MTKKTMPKPADSFQIELVGGPKDGDIVVVPGPRPPPEFFVPYFMPQDELMWRMDEIDPSYPIQVRKHVYRLDRFKGNELVYRYVEQQ